MWSKFINLTEQIISMSNFRKYWMMADIFQYVILKVRKKSFPSLFQHGSISSSNLRVVFFKKNKFQLRHSSLPLLVFCHEHLTAKRTSSTFFVVFRLKCKNKYKNGCYWQEFWITNKSWFLTAFSLIVIFTFILLLRSGYFWENLGAYIYTYLGI